MKRLKLEIKTFGVVLLTILIIACIVMPFIKHSISKLFSVVEKNNSITNAANYDNDYEESIKLNQDYNKKLSKIQLNIADNQRLSAIHGLMYETAQRAGAKIVTLNVVEESANTQQIRLQITMTGEFNAIGRFIYYVEKSDYIVSFDEMIISSFAKGSITSKQAISIHFADGQ